MMQRDMFRRHFHQTISIPELETIERAKLHASINEQQQLDLQRRRLIQQVLISDSTEAVAPTTEDTDDNPLRKSRIMFRRHFYQKPCDSCYASKNANQEASVVYQNAMKEFLENNNKASSTGEGSINVPVRPKQIPFVYNVSPNAI